MHPEIKIIIEAVAGGYFFDDVLGKSMQRPLPQLRRIIVYLAYRRTKLRPAQIAREINKSKAFTGWAYHRTVKDLEHDPELVKKVNNANKIIAGYNIQRLC